MASTVQGSGGVSSALMDAMNPKKSSTAQTDVEEAQDRFLKLLVTQMKNQDPMNPLDNAQVTSQFAQLSTVTGINKLNDAMTSMMAGYQAGQTLQAVGMIGHGVLSSGSRVDLVKGSGLLGVDLAEPAEKVSVSIRDAAGKEVRKLELGAQKAGSQPVAWDGKAEDGSALEDGHYTFEVTATRGDTKVTATALQFGLVDTVSTDAKGVKLNIGGLGSLNLADVRQIL
ncbi:MAG TPA: flagellar hook assembly protein FlgD [Noviherbaspirillum sp.]|nr:flagellar hook assembly protein FlgD [Noviherbaspirillum sp.]